MVSGGYNPQYQNSYGQPQQYSGQYSQGHQHRSPPPQGGYARNERYDEYDHGETYEHYDQNAQNRQWSHAYHEQRQYDSRQERPPQHEYGQRQGSASQYDNRYRNGGHGGLAPQGQENYRQLQHQDMRDTRSVTGLKPQARERERILKQDPESPVSVPWDNPFGAFPSKKQPDPRAARRSPEEQNRRSGPKGSQDRADQRPSTSHGPQTQARPNTSHGHQGGRPPSDSRVPQQNIPSRKMLPRYDQNDIQYREQPPRMPLPQRPMTGPVPVRVHDDNIPPQSATSEYSFDFPQPPSNGYAPEQTQHGYQPRQMSSGPPPQSTLGNQPTPGQRSSSNEQYRSRPPHGQRVPSNEQHNFGLDPRQQAPRREQHNPASQYGHQSSHPIYPPDMPSTDSSPGDQISPDIPNFDAMTNNTNEDQLGFPTTSKPAQPYRKATYGVSDPPPNARGLQPLEVDTHLVSPLAQFSFDLPSTDSPSRRTQTPVHAMPDQTSYGDHNTQVAQEPFGQSDTPIPLHPPRTASRGDVRRNPAMQYGQSPPPLPDAGYVQPPSEYPSQGQYGSERPARQHQNYNGPDPGPGPQSVRYDPARSGYDPRLQPRSNATPQPYQQQPPRPRTANSMGPGANGNERRISSDSYQHSVRSNNEPFSSRPIPVRPGLMQPPAQPPTPAQSLPQQRTTSSSARSENSASVTPMELNNLRDSYRNSPNDHALGLRFAKKLVEASKTLVNESGRMDPKQAAKNRERYVLDAHKVIKKLIGVGYTEAMFYMADCYGQGLMGLQADAKEAFSLYQSAAKLGHAQSAYRVAVCCELGPEEGGGTRRDPLKATQWYKRAAALGDSPAMYKMGMIQLKGLLGQPRNPREAISWLKRAAERADEENPHALHELGMLYESAEPTDIIVRDEKYALQLFTQAAELGYKYSQFKLGSTYEYGLLGCSIDPRMSIAWYSRAAAQGEHQSEFALSGWYLTGGGQPPPGQQPLLQQSDTEAYLWARKAASSGLAKAEYAMGYYTEVGIGVTANVEDAKKWYFRAAAQNHPKARERLEELKRGGARMQKTRVSRSNVGKQNEGECTVM